MAKTKLASVDVFGQSVYQYASESVADAGAIVAFPGLYLSTSALSGMLISRVEYVMYAIGTRIPGDADNVYFGLSIWDVPLNDLLLMQSNGLLDWNCLSLTHYLGTSGSGHVLYQPYVKDFSTLPGGGKICHPSGLYVWVRGQATTVAQSVHARVWYTLQDVTESFFREFFETQQQHLIRGA